jgi:hypothetical protein
VTYSRPSRATAAAGYVMIRSRSGSTMRGCL